MPLHPCLCTSTLEGAVKGAPLRTSKRFPWQFRKKVLHLTQLLVFVVPPPIFWVQQLSWNWTSMYSLPDWILPSSRSQHVSFQQNGTHQPYQRFFIREDSDDGRTSLQLFVQSFYMVWCSEISPQILGEHHDGHGTFKAFIKAWHGRFSNVSVVSDDGVPLFLAASMVSQFHISWSSALMPADTFWVIFPKCSWQNETGIFAMEPQEIHYWWHPECLHEHQKWSSEALGSTFFQFLEKGIPGAFGFVVIYFKSIAVSLPDLFHKRS